MDRLSSELLEQLGVSRESQAKLDIFVQVLLTWQKQFNLIAPSTIDKIWHRHVLDSLQLLPILPREVTAIADLGSGAGFPGLVLAAVLPTPNLETRPLIRDRRLP